ncbi:MAG TPA: YfiR family protein [Syntrophorhabdaceae bacterium]|nr:YfiR family protein [Syntrophorhabdaceae bacterium]
MVEKKKNIFFIALFFLFESLALSFFSASGEEKTVSEYEVKAAFLYNFVKFVDWPDGSQGEGKGVVNVCMFGSGPIDRELARLKDKVVKGRRFAVKYTGSTEEFRGCHMLFICSSEKGRLQEALKAVKRKGILTVGDTEGFARKGVIINFYFEDKKIRFEINLDAAREAQFSISSQLLRLARIVKDE